MVLLGVGVTVMTAGLEELPPKVARRAATKWSKSLGSAYTWAVPYCGATAKSELAAVSWAAASATRENGDRRKIPAVR
jgi:hypothetical protein